MLCLLAAYYTLNFTRYILLAVFHSLCFSHYVTRCWSRTLMSTRTYSHISLFSYSLYLTRSFKIILVHYVKLFSLHLLPLLLCLQTMLLATITCSIWLVTPYSLLYNYRYCFSLLTVHYTPLAQEKPLTEAHTPRALVTRDSLLLIRSGERQLHTW